MSGWAFLAVAALISAGVFLTGLRFSRVAENPWAGRRLLGMPVQGSELPVESVRRLGRIFMIGAPLFLLLVAALCLGLMGPVEGISTIRLGSTS